MKEYVLVVDDSPTVRAAAEFTLNEAGYNIKTAVNGLNGLKELESIHLEGNKTAMIISDVNMPEMDGFTFIRVVKKSPFKEIPVLILTTESQQTKKQEGKDVGAVGWLVKPFTPEQLTNVIKKFVMVEKNMEKTRSEITGGNLVHIFHNETISLIPALKEELKMLKNDLSNKEVTTYLFKILHYIRVTATFVDCCDISRFAYSLEDVVFKINESMITASEELINILLNGIEVLSKMLEGLIKPVSEGDANNINKDKEIVIGNLKKCFNL